MPVVIRIFGPNGIADVQQVDEEDQRCRRQTEELAAKWRDRRGGILAADVDCDKGHVAVVSGGMSSKARIFTPEIRASRRARMASSIRVRASASSTMTPLCPAPRGLF